MGSEAQGRPGVLLVGAAILDVMVLSARMDFSVRDSAPSEDIHISYGGDALNEAAVLAHLGKKVYLNTILGKDREGDMIEAHCQERGIELTGSCRREGLQTGINVVLVGEEGERHFLTNTNGSLRKLTLADVVETFPPDVGILSFASIFVFPDMGDPQMACVFRRAKEQGLLVCADMTKRKRGERIQDIRQSLAYVDYLLPNEEEAYLVTGADCPEEAARLLQEAGASHVVVKCGKKGCYVLDKGEGFYVPPASPVEAVDTTGAGDSFAGGFLYGLSEGWPIHRCAEFANACGAKAVTCVGAATWCDYD